MPAVMYPTDAYGNIATLAGPQTFTATKTFLAGSATSVPLVVRGAASQTANLLEFRDSGGTLTAFVKAGGGIVSIGGRISAGVDINQAQLESAAPAPTTRPLVVRGAASQTANLAEFQNSAGTAMVSIGNEGYATFRRGYFTSDITNGLVLGVQGAVGQTNNLFEARNSSNVAISRITAAGDIYSANQIGVIPETGTSAGTVRLVVRGAPSQSVNVAEFQNSANAVTFAVSGTPSSASNGSINAIATGGLNTIAIYAGTNANGNASAATGILRMVGHGIAHGDFSWNPGTTESWRFTETGSTFNQTNWSTVGVGTLIYNSLSARSTRDIKQDIQTIDVNSGPKTELQMRAASNPEQAQKRSGVPAQRTEPLVNRLKELRPVTFRYKTDDPVSAPLRHGFVAEELAAALPEVAVYDTAPDHEGTIDPQTGKKIKYNGPNKTSGAVYGYDLNALVTLTVATVQDMLERIEQLEAQIERGNN